MARTDEFIPLPKAYTRSEKQIASSKMLVTSHRFQFLRKWPLRTLCPCVCLRFSISLNMYIYVKVFISVLLEKARSRRYPTENITDADYADNIASMANISTQAESLLHSLEQTAGAMNLPGNADKMDNMIKKNQRGDIFTLNSGPLKLVDKFTYLGSNVTFTENYINTRRVKAWNAIERLSVIWKSDIFH